jgi:hypothetical protein
MISLTERKLTAAMAVGKIGVKLGCIVVIDDKEHDFFDVL